MSEPTVIGEVAFDAVCVVPPSLDVHVTVKPVMALPPLAFAVNATIAELLPRVTPVRLGAAGTVPATNELDTLDAALLPIAFVATTVQVYVLVLVSEPTVIGELAFDAVCVVPPSLEVQVAVNAVTASPPLLFAVNATVAELFPRITPVTPGADGLVAATKDVDAVDAALSPVGFVATTLQV